MTDLERIARWLVDIGYPYDFSCPGNPLPELLRRPLAQAWYDTDSDQEHETVDDYFAGLEEAGAW